MTWVKVDDRELQNKKVRTVSDAAYRLHAAARCHSSEHLLDGHVPQNDLSVLGILLVPQRNEKACGRLVNELVTAGMWHTPGMVCERCVDMRAEKQVTEAIPQTGWLIHDYLEYNPPAWKVRQERDEARRRAAESYARRKGGSAGADIRSVRPKNGNSAPESAGVSAPVSADPPYPVPVPSRISTRTPSHTTRARSDEDADRKRSGGTGTGMRAIGGAVAALVRDVEERSNT